MRQRLLLTRLDDWVAEHWPAVSATSEQLHRSTWQRSTCRGDDIAYAMLHDTAVPLGEMVVRRRPGTHRAVDEAVTGAAGVWCRVQARGAGAF